MREMIQMVVVLTILSCISGGLLASIKNGTKEQIEYQQLVFVKGPAIRAILEGSSNDPITDRFKIKDGDIERSFFAGAFDGKANTVTFEALGKGYGGDIGVMVGINLDDDKIVGVGVTTHSEPPESAPGPKPILPSVLSSRGCQWRIRSRSRPKGARWTPCQERRLLPVA